MNIVLARLVSNLFIAYFYDIKGFQILYSTNHKLNGGPNGFIFLPTKVLNPLSCVYVKNYKLNFG